MLCLLKTLLRSAFVMELCLLARLAYRERRLRPDCERKLDIDIYIVDLGGDIFCNWICLRVKEIPAARLDMN